MSSQNLSLIDAISQSINDSRMSYPTSEEDVRQMAFHNREIARATLQYLPEIPRSRAQEYVDQNGRNAQLMLDGRLNKGVFVDLTYPAEDLAIELVRYREELLNLCVQIAENMDLRMSPRNIGLAKVGDRYVLMILGRNLDNDVNPMSMVVMPTVDQGVMVYGHEWIDRDDTLSTLSVLAPHRLPDGFSNQNVVEVANMVARTAVGVKNLPLVDVF